jgi:Flp pilus assembly protein TadD
VLAGVGQYVAGLREPDRAAERFRAARRYFGKAHAVDSDDFRTLYHYARSRQLEANYPTENDVAALLQARALAPSVMEISMHAGAALMHRGRKDEAALVLSPVLNSPHGGEGAAVAKAILEGRSVEEAQTGALPAAAPAPGPAAPEKTADGG